MKTGQGRAVLLNLLLLLIFKIWKSGIVSVSLRIAIPVFLYRYVLSCGTDILIYNMFDTFITYIFYI